MMSEGVSGTSIFDPVLCEIAYRWFSPVGGLILDPFAGSGSTLAACLAAGIDAVGVEADAQYFHAAQQQIPLLAHLYPGFAGQSLEIPQATPLARAFKTVASDATVAASLF